MRELFHTASSRQSNRITTTITTFLFLLTFIAGPLQAADDATDTDATRVTQLAQADATTDQAAEEDVLLEEVVVVGTQIKGAAISEALAVSVLDTQEIEASGISSAQELLDLLPEQGQNFQTEAANAYNVNAVRGDVGAFNLRNMGTGNTLVLLNGRRMVQTAGYQTELVGGSFVPVNTVNPNEIPTYGIRRVEVLRDGASAIYGADAVAGVVNTVLQDNFEGLTIRARYDWYDNIPANNYRGTIKWGHNFNEGRTNLSLFADYYHRDRVNSQDDPRWSNSDLRYRLPEDSPFLYDEDGDIITTFRNDTIDSGFGQFDMSGSYRPLTDGSGEFETYPWDHAMCQHEDSWYINESMCGIRDQVNRDQYGSTTNYRHNYGAGPIGRDLRSDLDRFNIFLFLNHEFENGVEAYTELSYYQADTEFLVRRTTTLTNFEMYLGAESYYNPFGKCGSPNRLPDWLVPDLSCAGKDLRMDYYGWTEVPRWAENTAKTWRFLQGFRGTWGDWDWDTALVWSEAKRNDVTHNRISNTLMWEALHDPTPAGYNPFASGWDGYSEGTNIERTLIDVYRKNKTDLKMVDFKLSNPELFNMWAGPVGFLFGAEYREESFRDNRDPRLDGTITFTYPLNDTTYPYVSDVMNSSPSSDSWGSRDTTSAFFELAIPVFDNFDLQAALRYEDASDYGDTTVGKLAFGWRVFEPLLIRGSWSEAFRAPNLVTVFEGLVVRANSRTSYVCRYAEELWDEGRSPDDPRYEEARDELDCSDSVQRRAEGANDLVPEESTNTSIGFVWEPTENFMFTLDFWRIEKTDTIGLFGETNHSLLDLLMRIGAGDSNCTGVGNPVQGYSDPDPDQVEYYAYAGICPVGQWIYTDDTYKNLDTRIVEGHDVGIFYSTDNDLGSWDLSIRGSFYDKYVQKPGPDSQALIDASESGVFPAGFPIPTGFGDLLRQDGNQTTKYNASLRWRRDMLGAGISAYYLSDFIDTGPGVRQGQKWVVKSMTTYNGYFDYYADLFNTETRFRFGVNNMFDQRAPLADEVYGFAADAHRDYGRYFYVDVRVDF